MAEAEKDGNAPEAEGSAAEPRKGGGMKTLIGLVVGVLFLVGSSVAVGVLMFPSEEPAGEAGEEGEAVPVEPATKILAPVPEILVNLADSKGLRLLQATMTLELEAKDGTAAEARFQEILPRVQDRLIKILSSLTSEDIDGGTSKEFVQSRIKDHLNLGVLREEEFEVTDVYFTEFVIQ
ncbi:MAG: flagellar basal body-associated protein FliL [Planctomycetota bacterium JB042]